MTTKKATTKPKKGSKVTPDKPIPNDIEVTPVTDREPVIVADRDNNPSPKTPKIANFYKLERILKENADYNLIVGERGNGKTYAVQEYLLKCFLDRHEQCFMLRRWMEDVKQSNAQNFWDGNLLAKLSDMSGGLFTTIIYRAGKYIAVRYDEKGKPVIDDANTVGYVWDVSESERLKGQSFPNVTNIVYEEFISLSKEGYNPNEITLFLNIVSTIVRDRTNVKIWLLGNTVNPYNPFFNHFGIKGLELKQGDIWTKTDYQTGCKVAVEFCEKRRKGDLYGTSAKYFAFGTNNGATDMIVSGQWQIPDYPTMKFKQRNSRLRIFVKFDERLMIMHVMTDEKGGYYLFVQTVSNKTPIGRKYWVLDMTPNTNPYYFTSFANLPAGPTTEKINDLLNNNKIWFDDKMTGSYFYNFLSQSTPVNRRLGLR